MPLASRAHAQYLANSKLLADVRQHARVSLRQIARETGVLHNTISRLEHGHDISAKAYVAVLGWVVRNNPNITG